jgi:hypothetical protein
VATQPLRRLDPTAGDADLDPPLGKVAAAAALIVGLVGVNLLGAAVPTADRGPHLGDVVQQRLEHCRIGGVGRGYQQRQRQPGALSGQVELGPGLGAVDRVCAGQVPPEPRAG